jgi:hypothetical protein
MSLARLHSYGPPEPEIVDLLLFKEDRPRRIDRVISFFGESSDNDDPCGERLLDSFDAESEADR